MTRMALARLHRPRRFGEVAMQEHVSETLKVAVARGRVAHAYLFSGPRGVGKTTAARVLAMALNCPNRGDDGEPCGECESCQRIWSGRTSLDVVEIDAASNRGVDDARELRERAMYAPTDENRYKVYIIDEAHMLTREAWNALLKILEEPPPRVIFVFATTEPQKIQQAAPPILSRCQRFDFRRISVAAIVERLRQVLEEEGIEADEEALVPIARRAEGGLRDALSLLDQVLSFTDRRLEAEDVRRVLGLVSDELYLDLFDILAERRYGDVFRFVQHLLDEGYDLAEFYRGLADALRTLLIVKFDGAEAAEVRPDLRDRYTEAADRFDVGDLLRMLAQVAELDVEGRLRKSASPRIMLEALLLRFAHLDRTVALEELIQAAGGDEGGDVSAAPRPTPRPRSAPAPSGAGGSGGRRTPQPPARPPAAGGAGSSRAAGPGGSGPGPQAPAEQAKPAAGRESSPGAPASGPGGGRRGGGRLADVFRSNLKKGEGIPPGLGVFLKAAQVREAGEDRLVVELPPGPGLDRLTSEPAAQRTIEEALSERVGRPVTLEVQALAAGGGGGGQPEPPPRLTPEQVKRDRLRRMAEEEPVLREAVEEWDLELLD